MDTNAVAVNYISDIAFVTHISIYGINYSRMEQLKFVEESLSQN